MPSTPKRRSTVGVRSKNRHTHFVRFDDSAVLMQYLTNCVQTHHCTFHSISHSITAKILIYTYVYNMCGWVAGISLGTKSYGQLAVRPEVVERRRRRSTT